MITVDSLEKAIELAEGSIYIIGGYNLFKEAIPMVDVMYITEINLTIDDDIENVFFPIFNEADFEKEKSEETDEYKRYIYTRKK